MNSEYGEEINRAMALAWHEDTARNSIERWLKISEQEKWKTDSVNLSLLVRIFGASWYFTRFIFVLGEDVFDLLKQKSLPVFDRQYFISFLQPSLDASDIEYRINKLRLLKNTCMLQILIAYLNEKITIETLESALTELADATLELLVTVFQILPQHRQFPVTILGMGRMAGYEMTYGSDLDLIFLFEPDGQELYADIGKTIRLLLRTIAQPASTGSLYEVDMRLRPHGNSGPLVTSYNSFIEHHTSKRDIWEKQMMTRCRPVLMRSDNVDAVLKQVRTGIYAQYDMDFLRMEIISMRMRVQKELGSPRGRYEIKRGYGGIMDIDFISHYYQLGYGHKYTSLQTGSTRGALRELVQLQLISHAAGEELIDSYNYLKRVEMYLRLFDMKSVDSFTSFAEDNISLARAMGHGDDTRRFLGEYETVTHLVRKRFTELLEV